MGSLSGLKVSCLLMLSLLLNSSSGLLLSPNRKIKLGKFPPTCTRIECPSYDVIFNGKAYEIRRYNYTVWMSTSTIDDISFVSATRTGFLKLFDYIQGKNKDEKKIEMTAPVITQVIPSDGPFCKSSFVVSFYVPKFYQPNPPPAHGLHAQKWEPVYTAVRQFDGFVSDDDTGKEAAALYASLAGSRWADAIDKTSSSDPTSSYIVAQYNSPFEYDSRVNEIWMTFNMQDELLM
ncbi:SOUL hem-binding protein [Dillenia turbinata]|uniref:SOUL hem-binding protein n=1 Tax=Dillenia turbinata TaxID=194707 RepID=A0AAN8ZEQ8_9MAGN